MSEQISIAKQALKRPNMARFIYGQNPCENALTKAQAKAKREARLKERREAAREKSAAKLAIKESKQQACKAFSVRPNLAVGKVQDTATTHEHHNDTVNSGITKLDDLLIERELNKLTDKATYEKNYYDNL